MMTAAEMMLADQLLTQGLSYWAVFASKKAAGTLTLADLDAAGADLDADITKLAADIVAARAAKPA